MVEDRKVKYKGKIMAGKGSNPRPVNKKVFDSNFDEIDWKNSAEARKIVGLAFVGNMAELEKELKNQDKKVKTVKTKIGKAVRFIYK
jgi:hypothetical protein